MFQPKLQTGPLVREYPSYRVVLIDPGSGGQSLKGLMDVEDAITQSKRVVALGDVLRPFVTDQDLFAPSVDHQSGRIAFSYLLRRRVRLSHGLALLRDTGVAADGVPLKPGDGFLMSTVGALVVAHAGDRVIAASATRDSLIDRKALMGESPNRNGVNLITSIVDFFHTDGFNSDSITLRVFFSYHAKDFAHPLGSEGDAKYELNRRMMGEAERHGEGIVLRKNGVGYLNLGRLVAAQAEAHGIGTIEVVDYLPSDERFAHSRHVLLDKRNERNLVLVLHKK